MDLAVVAPVAAVLRVDGDATRKNLGLSPRLITKIKFGNHLEVDTFLYADRRYVCMLYGMIIDVRHYAYEHGRDEYEYADATYTIFLHETLPTFLALV